jgi:dihydrofolate synthase / folylpolyglutamate synthase
MIDPRYQAALDYLYDFIDYEKMKAFHNAYNYDLRRVFELLEGIGNPHRCAPVVHIAGTKGKGSTAAMTAAALRQAGYVTGLYTSPHLIDLRERFRIDDEMISEAELIALTDELKPVVSDVNRRATYGELTTFEVLTALGFLWFARRKVEMMVIEVGLGGRLDATNVVTPELAVITPVSLDHTEILGDTVAAIAGEKAGIIKAGIPVVSAPQSPEAARVIQDVCLGLNAPLVAVGEAVTWQPGSHHLTGQSFTVNGALDSYALTIPLPGRHQQENAATAVAALEVLKSRGFQITSADIIEGLRKVVWEGRFQVLGQNPVIVLDGAHNPEAARKFREGLEEYFGRPGESTFEYSGATLVMGASVDKDTAGVLRELAPYFGKFVATTSRHPRAMPGEELRRLFAELGIDATLALDVPTAVEMALRGDPDQLVCFTGSLFVVGEVLEVLRELP